MATKRKLKTYRKFIESINDSDSYIKVINSPWGGIDLKLASCDRIIEWGFGKPGEKRAKRKIANVKKIVDEVYNYLHEVD